MGVDAHDALLQLLTAHLLKLSPEGLGLVSRALEEAAVTTVGSVVLLDIAGHVDAAVLLQLGAGVWDGERGLSCTGKGADTAKQKKMQDNYNVARAAANMGMS